MSLTKQLTSLIKDTGTHFLIGSSEFSKFQRKTVGPVKIGNAALFFSPEGEILGQYLKIHLVPFGEYIPLEGTLQWPDFIVPEGKEYHEIPGKEYTLFKLKEAKFGVVICWEHVFPELFRTFVTKGADFMLNITNEGWFGDTAAPHQMLAISVFRSVENKRAIARAANTGISCFIDPYGRITGRVRNNQKDTFVDGYLTEEIPLSSQITFYTMHGDILAYLCLAVTVIMTAVSLMKVKDRS
jgi:apolipoprotein N-acyltransferase